MGIAKMRQRNLGSLLDTSDGGEVDDDGDGGEEKLVMLVRGSTALKGILLPFTECPVDGCYL